MGIADGVLVGVAFGVPDAVAAGIKDAPTKVFEVGIGDSVTTGAIVGLNTEVDDPRGFKSPDAKIYTITANIAIIKRTKDITTKSEFFFCSGSEGTTGCPTTGAFDGAGGGGTVGA